MRLCGQDWKAKHPNQALRKLDYQRWAQHEARKYRPRVTRVILYPKTLTKELSWVRSLLPPATTI